MRWLELDACFDIFSVNFDPKIIQHIFQAQEIITDKNQRRTI